MYICTSLDIAEARGMSHKNVLELIRKRMPEFEEIDPIKESIVSNRRGKPTFMLYLTKKHLIFYLNLISKYSDIVAIREEWGIEEDLIISQVRAELEVGKMIKSIIDGFSSNTLMELELIEQDYIGNHRADFVIYQNYGIEKIPLLCIEVNEVKSHKYQFAKDEERAKKITEKINRKYYANCSKKFKVISCTDENDSIYAMVGELVKALNENDLNVF